MGAALRPGAGPVRSGPEIENLRRRATASRWARSTPACAHRAPSPQPASRCSSQPRPVRLGAPSERRAKESNPRACARPGFRHRLPATPAALSKMLRVRCRSDQPLARPQRRCTLSGLPRGLRVPLSQPADRSSGRRPAAGRRGVDDRARTGGLHLGKVELFQLSYVHGGRRAAPSASRFGWAASRPLRRTSHGPVGGICWPRSIGSHGRARSDEELGAGGTPPWSARPPGDPRRSPLLRTHGSNGVRDASLCRQAGGRVGADGRVRTDDGQLGRLALYQLSYVRVTPVERAWWAGWESNPRCVFVTGLQPAAFASRHTRPGLAPAAGWVARAGSRGSSRLRTARLTGQAAASHHPPCRGAVTGVCG